MSTWFTDKYRLIECAINKNLGQISSKHADLGMELMHERNAHNFPPDFA